LLSKRHKQICPKGVLLPGALEVDASPQSTTSGDKQILFEMCRVYPDKARNHEYDRTGWKKNLTCPILMKLLAFIDGINFSIKLSTR
jgi:hypothetical protein